MVLLPQRIGQRAWRTLHYTTFLAFPGATLHGLADRSDSGAPWAHGVYLGPPSVVFLLVYRIAMSLSARAKARDRAAEDAFPLGGGRSDSFPGAAQRAAAIADGASRAGRGHALPIRERRAGRAIR